MHHDQTRTVRLTRSDICNPDGLNAVQVAASGSTQLPAGAVDIGLDEPAVLVGMAVTPALGHIGRAPAGYRLEGLHSITGFQFVSAGSLSITGAGQHVVPLAPTTAAAFRTYRITFVSETSEPSVLADVQLLRDVYADDEELYKYAVADQIGWDAARLSASAADGWRSSGSWVIPGLSVSGLIGSLSMSLDGQTTTHAEFSGQTGSFIFDIGFSARVTRMRVQGSSDTACVRTASLASSGTVDGPWGQVATVSVPNAAAWEESSSFETVARFFQFSWSANYGAQTSILVDLQLLSDHSNVLGMSACAANGGVPPAPAYDSLSTDQFCTGTIDGFSR
eukprot:COSAG02_NODE_865_length_16381_cov_14.799533_4_plen_336_part_00